MNECSPAARFVSHCVARLSHCGDRISPLSRLLSSTLIRQSASNSKVLHMAKARHAYNTTVADQMSFTAVRRDERQRRDATLPSPLDRRSLITRLLGCIAHLLLRSLFLSTDVLRHSG